MKYPKVLNQFKDRAGELHRPSNGTEGMMFEGAFCQRCIHDRNHDCEIVGMVMAYYKTDPEYPKEWVYSDDGWPICTKFQKWDGSEPPEPKPVEPDDPNQLCINFYLSDVIEELEGV